VIRCSYGPAGAAVIESTLMVLFGPTNFRTACTLPLSFRTYTQYFLTPHIACCLIAEDKDIDLEGGWEVMMQTADLGETLHSLTIQEDLLETIITANAKRREERNIVDSNATETKELADPVNVAMPVSSILSISSAIAHLTRLISLSRHHLFQDVWLVNWHQPTASRRPQPKLGNHFQSRNSQSRL
jgi:hypothetical protein